MSSENIIYIDSHKEILSDKSKISQMKNDMQSGKVYIVKNIITEEKINKIKDYLINIGRHSLPNYKRIEEGCPNFHRLNLWDKRSYVQACFHQFVFFPWNQDMFNFFDVFQEIYYLRNLLSGNLKEKFLRIEPEENCVARIAFQFYPKGQGAMNEHMDPVGHHQVSVPILQMTKKGVDFKEGGAYVVLPSNKKIVLDDIASPGDVIYFHPRLTHGVDLIDPGSQIDWLSFEGRWMILFAVNKLFDNTQIEDAIDIVKASKASV
ncbi:MAG: hypothetical protein HYZ79_01655 [Candidatus Melainabacteria bacterium]|nr:hypothetical protein [Candidatus Melainabacteria bacterium]